VAAKSVDTKADNVVVFTRVIDAPRSLVYQMWTDPRHVVHWWQPKEFSRPTMDFMDVKVGGGFRVTMPHQSGVNATAYGTYDTVDPQRRLAYADFCDWDGKLVHNAHITVDFADEGAKTKLTITGVFEWLPDRGAEWTEAMMKRGWYDGWDANMTLLEGYAKRASAAAAVPALTMMRTFDAPRALVFKAWTDAKQLAIWWGPHTFTNPHCQTDPRVGGKIRVCMRSPEGHENWMAGEFEVIDEPRLLVFTAGLELPDGTMGFNIRNTVTFEDVGGKTRLTLHAQVIEINNWDLKDFDGMEEGWSQSLERLEALVTKH
jgi:uncharacterized protein YndB with AHSA1/START domain